MGGPATHVRGEIAVHECYPILPANMGQDCKYHLDIGTRQIRMTDPVDATTIDGTPNLEGIASGLVCGAFVELNG